MSEEQPHKNDTQNVLKKLRGISSNKTCFDCGAKNPTWASVTYGVFLCIDCSAVHRSLGVHLTFIRSTQLDTNWTWLQLRAMQLGGNANAAEFFRSHGATTTDAQQKYNSRAAQLYREKLQQMSIQAMKNYGTKLYLDGVGGSEHDTTKDKKDEHFDFFESHVKAADENVWTQDTETQPHFGRNKSENLNTQIDDMMNPTTESGADSSAAPKSAIVGVRKPGAKSSAKKGGKLGAQRVEANFEDFEKQAEEAEKRRAESAALRMQFDVKQSAPMDESQLSSARLAYQDVDADRKKEEERLKKTDPKKADQLERLGMGVGQRGKISHSILSDMTKIEQERPQNTNTSDSRSYGAFDRQPEWSRDRDRDEDSPRMNRSRKDYSSFEDSMERMSMNDRNDRNSRNYSDTSRSSNWNTTDEPSRSSYSSSSYQNSDNGASARSNKKTVDHSSAPSEDATKKFGNAKAISSDMYFGNKDSDYETKSNLSRFEGKTSISSADYFGTGSPAQTPTRGGGGYVSNLNIQTPDLTEIKEGVRQGITKIAGRLATMTNNVVTNIQDRYH